MAPLERFMHVEASSGMVLLFATAVALTWANSPWREQYAAFQQLGLGIQLDSWRFVRPLRFWVNDGLMTVFFFVVGLEVKRELVVGVLSSARRAALPMAGALGGMVVPALIYFSLNRDVPTANGWAIPMATDIAFAIGLLSLLGSRVPRALRAFLLALAVVDDIGAIAVIALFHSSKLHFDGLALLALGLGAIAMLNRAGFRREVTYVVPAVLVWAGMYRFGIHPTLAGVLLGLMTPHRTWFSAQVFSAEARRCLEDHERGMGAGGDVTKRRASLDRLTALARETQSPLTRLEASLHTIVAFVIMPLFAVMNAGAVLSDAPFAEQSSQLAVAGIGIGLVVGKPVGVLLACAVAVKLGATALPEGVRWRDLLVVGSAAGIGFTMSVFIAELALAGTASLAAAKVAVVGASLVSALVALALGRVLWARPRRPEAAAQAEGDAARSGSAAAL